MVQACLVIRGQGDDQRSLLPQLHVDAGGRAQFLGEGGPARLAGAPEVDQGFLAGLGFGTGRSIRRRHGLHRCRLVPRSNTLTGTPLAASRQAMPRPITRRR